MLVIAGASLAALLLLVGLLLALRRQILHDGGLQDRLIEQTRTLDLQSGELEQKNERLEEQAAALAEQSSRLATRQSELAAANVELQRASTEAEAAHELLRLLIDSVESGMYGLDEDGRCTFMNPAGARILGYQADELIGERMHERVHHSRVDGTPHPYDECPIINAIRNGKPVRVDDEVYWRSDGSLIFVDYSAAPLIMHDHVRGAVVNFMDITERKREQEIREFAADATAALSSSLDYHKTLKTVAELAVPRLGDWCAVDMLEDNELRRLAVVHREPKRLHVVHELTRMRPPRLDSPIGSGNVISTGRPELYEELPEELLVAAAEGDVELIQFIQAMDLRSLMSVPLMARGHPIGAIVCVMAESGRRFTKADLKLAQEFAARASLAIENSLLYREAEEARKRAEGADRAKAQFLAAMSHELRTPLNAIAGYAELLAYGVLGSITDRQREALERITRSQKTLLSLINDILNFSKLREGFVDVVSEDVLLDALLNTLVDWIEPQRHAKRLRYKYERCPPDVVVRGDREKIQQVMTNLLSNAVKFTPPGGAVTLECTEENGTVAISVRDTGPGIPADKLEAIFEPFVQINRDANPSAQGTGLGLAISRDLARAMGGDIRATSQVGKGSTFIFTLPRAIPGGS